MGSFLTRWPRGLKSTTARVLVEHSTRSFSSSQSRHVNADPQVVADAFLSKFAKGQTFVRKQLIDANQLRLFSLTFDRPYLWPDSSFSTTSLEQDAPVDGTPVPPSYHWIYFTPAQLPGILGQDGTDASFNPNEPFTRRMWAGGSMHWPGADPQARSQALLRVGDTATEVTRLLSCEPKTIKKTGEAMLLVGVEKEFRNSKDELCLVDRRNWVFRPALDLSWPATPTPKPDELSASELEKLAQGKIVREHVRDEVMLFRMSALTFNAHRIHYDRPWATEVEGHRSVVVHGPISLLSMMDLWRDEVVKSGTRNAQDNIVYPKEISYRATSPVYANEPYRAMMDEGGVAAKEAEVEVVSNDGTRCMKGKIVDW